MITRNNILVLRDAGDGGFTDIVIFDDEVDIEAIRESINKGLRKMGEWTYDDVLDELENFGGYSVIPVSAIETIEY